MVRFLFGFLFLFLSSCFQIPIYNTYFQNPPTIEHKEICTPKTDHSSHHVQ